MNITCWSFSFDGENTCSHFGKNANIEAKEASGATSGPKFCDGECPELGKMFCGEDLKTYHKCYAEKNRLKGKDGECEIGAKSKLTTKKSISKTKEDDLTTTDPSEETNTITPEENKPEETNSNEQKEETQSCLKITQPTIRTGMTMNLTMVLK